jgi:hypothetical protein
MQKKKIQQNRYTILAVQRAIIIDYIYHWLTCVCLSFIKQFDWKILPSAHPLMKSAHPLYIVLAWDFLFFLQPIMATTMGTLPAWKKFLQSSLKDNIAKVGTSASYASLATVTMENKPAVRTVVMRGFVGEHHSEETDCKSDLLVIITDKTSNKVEEIRNNPNTEINW